ncbi:MAG: ribonuclease III [Lachnospiraceae bacterium]|nr:ribonuclease III [Lachnospiraceae bacterium]
MVNNKDFSKLEQGLGYTFKDKDLLKLALTHSSYSNELKLNKYGNYERLEFLGDAVLELTTSWFFYTEYPQKNEGELTRMRSSMVCEMALAYCARLIELQNFIYLGKGEEATGGRDRDSIVSDVFEAVIGAIYLDGGFDEANKFVKKHVLTDMENKQLFYDAKTILQEYVQKNDQKLCYELMSESGPDHDKTFEVAAFINDKEYSRGTGKSKKAAEQQAAYAVLMDLKKDGKVK